ncbi:hypothetical protein RclHR1_09710005 [Rhizophagus clarus]|uniref:F-box domain-containing protein n=1 Tax=Rhizophagus clarus TaxID=94130 RepID=A0A2Z6S5B3_9GLOM|nr:hypothetical protein RclHR1_09710005 [Rhizophagus clarus]GES99183.1 hypothetical protein GLOIN_2v1876788 [Rhizophagus clarus]
MVKLNIDVIHQILKEFQNDNETLYSCLFVNKTWCETTIPILWKNPTRECAHINEYKLFNVILLHLSEESRNNLKKQGIHLFTETNYHQPLFNYISFWRDLVLFFLERMLYSLFGSYNIDEPKISILRNELLNLFDQNQKFTSLNLVNTQKFQISGNEQCFSGLEHLCCSVYTDSNILERLATTNTSIKKLSFEIHSNINNPGILRIIEAQNNLKEVVFNHSYSPKNNVKYCKALEVSLIKCADTIQYLRIDWEPITNYLSFLVNLVSLEILATSANAKCIHLENVTLTHLKILKANFTPFKSLISLIKNTKGNLNEITILYRVSDYGRLIRAIYQNCPNLNYLRLSMNNDDILEFGNLLTNCRFLSSLHIMEEDNLFYPYGNLNWNELLKILVKSSPICLLEFTFFHKNTGIMLEALKIFLENWKDKHPILMLKVFPLERDSIHLVQQLNDLIQEYTVKGTIKSKLGLLSN